ncbi:HAD hydrolase-like protein [Candidatus Woesearchaeota archaeon]|nr:HAD hydrolase-like protein [Candidatus Woesearchaeota archaeon]
MRIAFDLDGTLYDSVAAVLELDNDIFRRFGYLPIEREFYKRNFQSHDWKKLYSDLGIREADIPAVIDLFKREFDNVEPPRLISGAREVVDAVHQHVGDDRLYFVTNEPAHRVEKRFKRDGFERHLQRVHSPFQGKAKELHALAVQQCHRPFVYIGDLVSDGEACRAARNNGASNLRFYAILHEYSMNLREDLQYFVDANPDFAKTVECLEDVVKLVLHN